MGADYARGGVEFYAKMMRLNRELRERLPTAEKFRYSVENGIFRIDD
jgi:hypothetical protein